MTPPSPEAGAGPVVVLAEHRRGELADITLELLACGRSLCDAEPRELRCLLLTAAGGPFRALPLAADRLLLLEDAAFAEFNTEVYLQALVPLLRGMAPRLILLGNTSVGADLAGPLSVALGAQVVGNGVAVASEAGRIEVTSKVYGGKILARSEVSGMGIVLLSPGSYPGEKGMHRQVPSVDVVPVAGGSQPRVRFERYVEPEVAGPDLSKSPLLVAVGRGIQGKDNIPLAEELAAALGGAVCATRPVVDQGWMPKSRQVGRSGLTVKPRLYLSLGVSGAPEHVEGMKDSELIVAVNTDPTAPIFDVAHYGAAMDLMDLMPALTEAVRKAKGN